MLVLAFHVGTHRFALRCADVVEVVPRVLLRAIPHAPPAVAGMFTYRGSVVPVIDLSQLMWKTPCADRMSTRVMLVRRGAGSTAPGAAANVVGLLAERVTEAITLDTSRAAPPGISVEHAPYLGEVYFDSHGMIQLVRLEEIFQGVGGGLLPATEGTT